MLFHACLQGYIIVLGPASKGVKEQHRVVVTPLQELAASVLEKNQNEKQPNCEIHSCVMYDARCRK